MLFCVYFHIVLTYFARNVDATVSNDEKELMDIRTVITHLGLDKDFFFNESDAKDIMLLPDKAQIPVIRMKKMQGAEIRVPCENH